MKRIPFRGMIALRPSEARSHRERGAAVTAPTDQQVLDSFPDAPIDHDNKEYYRGLLQRRLLVNRCTDCGRWSQPPRGICPACWSDAVVPTEVSGRGTVYLTMLLHQGPQVDGVDYSTPHPVVLVDLEEQEGLRATATVADVANEDIRIGMPVELTWLERGGAPTPAFRPRS
jgi:uncharacterized OB-fold protein